MSLIKSEHINELASALVKFQKEEEVWRKIPGFGGDYIISNTPRIISFKRSKPIIMKLRKLPDGRYYVALSKNGKPYKKYVHRLVALSFHGPAPKGKPCALHKDDDWENNTPENIYWGDKTDNMRDRRKNSHINEGENCGASKLTATDVLDIRARVNDYNRQELAEEYGVHPCTISDIKLRKSWKHI